MYFWYEIRVVISDFQLNNNLDSKKGCFFILLIELRRICSYIRFTICHFRFLMIDSFTLVPKMSGFMHLFVKLIIKKQLSVYTSYYFCSAFQNHMSSNLIQETPRLFPVSIRSYSNNHIQNIKFSSVSNP